MLKGALKELGITKYSLYDDGDDCALIIEREDLQRAYGLSALFLEMGHELTISKAVDQFEHIEFCQMRPTFIDGEWTMTPFLYKTLCNGYSSYKYYDEPRAVVPYLRTLALSNLARGIVPCVTELALKVLHRVGKGKLLYDPEIFNEMLAKKISFNDIKFKEPSFEDYNNYAFTWQLPVEVLRRMTRSIADMPLELIHWEEMKECIYTSKFKYIDLMMYDKW
jgi:hypothetical protein